MARSLNLWFGLCKKALVFSALFLVIFLPAQVMAKDGNAGHRQSSAAKSKTIAAIKAMKQERWGEAADLTAQAKDPLASKIYYWMMLTKRENKALSDDAFIRISHFMRDNPDWPNISKLKLAAEGVMPENLSNAEVIGWYDDFPPVTAYGAIRYMEAMLIEGKQDQARKFLSNWWADTLVPRDQQKQIYQKFSAFLTPEAHKRRFDFLLFKEGYDSARAVASVLGKGYLELAEARIALARGDSNAGALVNKVPRSLQNDAGLLFERLRWRRKKDMNNEAIQILKYQPSMDRVYNAEDWWKERHIIIRRLMEQGRFQDAHALAVKHGQKSGASYAEAEWLAGWLSLRYIRKPAEAFAHFKNMYDQVETPLSKTRGAYWAGRAAMVMDKRDAAKEWFLKGAKTQTFYYGQLSAASLFMQSALPKEKPYIPSQDEKAAFAAHDLIEAYYLFAEAGYDSDASRFLQAFLESNGTPQAYYFAAETASSKKDYYDAVKIAKDATRKGLFLTKQSYPLVTDWVKGKGGVEWALVHSLIRQESMFDTNAKSSAGAMGLMQLMPATAREVSTKLGVGYDQASLTARPEYNIRLGTRYLERLLDRFDGSYPMAIAAYNAGPGRVDDWIETFGDPRSGDIDYIDWIELIPIYETRNYVQRVMEGVYVYRLRLKGIQEHPNNPIHIAYNVHQ